MPTPIAPWRLTHGPISSFQHVALRICEFPRDCRGPLKEGRLLALLPFPATVSHPTAESAANRKELLDDLYRDVGLSWR